MTYYHSSRIHLASYFFILVALMSFSSHDNFFCSCILFWKCLSQGLSYTSLHFLQQVYYLFFFSKHLYVNCISYIIQSLSLYICFFYVRFVPPIDHITGVTSVLLNLLWKSIKRYLVKKFCFSLNMQSFSLLDFQ